MIRLALLLLLLAGCSPKSVDDYNTAGDDTDTVRLLNQREYGKVIWLIESQNGKKPSNTKTAFLLGQAYLGKAGLEPFVVAAAVSGAQDGTSAEARALLPACPTEALAPGRDLNPLCLLKRVYFHVPDPDVYEMARARELFRYAYPDPSAAPEWVNIVVGSLEAASVVKRAGALFLLAQRAIQRGQAPGDRDLRWVAKELSLLIDDADQSLRRAQHTGNKIAALLTGQKGAAWFEEADGALRWIREIGLGNILELVRTTALSPADQERYGPLLEKIRDYLEQQNARIAG